MVQITSSAWKIRTAKLSGKSGPLRNMRARNQTSTVSRQTGLTYQSLTQPVAATTRSAQFPALKVVDMTAATGFS